MALSFILIKLYINYAFTLTRFQPLLSLFIPTQFNCSRAHFRPDIFNPALTKPFWIRVQNGGLAR